MKNKLRAIWHILLGDSVMYRITASRNDKISGGGRWYPGRWTGLSTFVVIECQAREDMLDEWLRTAEEA